MHTYLLEAHGHEKQPDHVLNVEAIIEVRDDEEHGVVLNECHALSWKRYRASGLTLYDLESMVSRSFSVACMMVSMSFRIMALEG